MKRFEGVHPLLSTSLSALSSALSRGASGVLPPNAGSITTRWSRRNVGGANKTALSRGEMLQCVATELAFGHGGLTSKDAEPLRIQYGEGLVDASTYIRAHPDYANHTPPHFMSRVKVTCR